MLSDRIAALRRAAGMNQNQLAQKLNVSPSAIGMYERGCRCPSIDILISLSQLFDVSLDYLLTGMEYPDSKKYTAEERIPDNCPCKICYWKDYRSR